VVGISFHAGHLRATGKANLEDIARHARHFASVAGGPQFVGLGSDLDGGFNAAESAIRRLDRMAELRTRLQRHFSREQVDGILGDNWLDFLERALPA
jgi:membrane dipeptidase